MMLLPELINIAGRQIQTLSVVAIVGLVCWGFIVWYESRKDGFATEKFFDLVFVSLIFGGLSFYGLKSLYDWAAVYRLGHLVLKFERELFLSVFVFLASLLPILYFSKKWKWSVFRILDIYAQAFGLLILFLAFGRFLIWGQKEYVILVSFLLSLYISVLKFRGYRFQSGFIFSILLFFISIIGFFFFRREGYLLLYLLLFTIGIVNLYLRWKKSMLKGSFPKQFLINIKNKLSKRDRDLAEEQKELVAEDPYLQEGRAMGNADNMDEAQEDIGKELTDAHLNIVKALRHQIRKALAAIKIGKYGVCEVCGKKIDPARLKVYPEATTCIECATDISQIQASKEA